MRTDAKTARKIGALYFDEETILEVKQLGGGGSGVGGANGLAAKNLVTGESTDDTINEQREEITRLKDANAELTERLEEAEAALADAPRPLNLSVAMAAGSLSDSSITMPYYSQNSIVTGPLEGNRSLLTAYILPSGSAFQSITIRAAAGDLTGITANFSDTEQIISSIINTGAAIQISINNSKLRDYIAAHSGVPFYRVFVTFTRA